MSTVLQQLVIEQFREPGTSYLSPVQIGEFFGYEVQELAKRAHVHRNTPIARPQALQLQKHLQDMVRVLAVVTELTGDEKRAAFLVRNEPLRAFGYKTADAVIQEGRTDAVIAYLESLSGGAAG